MEMDVRIRRICGGDTRMKALVSVTLEGSIAIHDIKLIRRDDGSLFAAMPSRKDENGVFRDVVHPIGSEARRELEAKIIQEYEYYLSSIPGLEASV